MNKISKEIHSPNQIPNNYSDILNIMSFGNIVHFAFLDQNFKILAVNNSWGEDGLRRGVPADYQWIGKSYLDPIEKASCGGDEDAMIAISKLSDLKNGIIHEFTMIYPCNEPEKKKWFRCNAKSINHDGDRAFIICHYDITDEIEKKDFLEKENQLLSKEKSKIEAIESQMGYGRWTYNNSTNEFSLSKTADLILQYVSHNGIFPLNDLIKCLAEDDRQVFLSKLNRTLIDGSPLHFDGEFKLQNNNSIFLSFSGFLDKKCGTKEMQLHGLIRDITVETEIKNKLSHMQKIDILGKLTAEISHNFNNALSVIKGNVELLREFSDDKTMRFINRIERASNQATDLTEKMSRFITAEEHFQESFCIIKRMDEVIEISEKILGNDINIKMNMPNGKLLIEADPLEFDNSILNLLINSRDAMKNGGIIYISIEENAEMFQDQPTINLIIKDQGSGIAVSKIDKIFEPFYTTKSKGKGTGLGLSAVSSFVKQSNGKITVSSHENEGTEFTLTFPLATSELISEECLSCKRYKPLSECLEASILILEDETDVRSMVAETLSRKGMIVYEASTSEEAKEIVKKDYHIDLLLTDIVLGPNDSGTDFAQFFKSHYQNTPVIFTSGYANDLLHSKNLDTSSVHFIPKPYSLDALVKAIEHIILKSDEISSTDLNEIEGFCSVQKKPCNASIL